MDNVFFNQTGGFPLSTDILSTVMEEGMRSSTALAMLIGEDRFLKAPEILPDNETVKSNLVILNGELLPFEESSFINPLDYDDPVNVVGIFEEEIDREFQDLSVKTVMKKRVARLGSSAIYQRHISALKNWQFSIHNILETISKKLSVFVSGGAILLWNKPAILIPSGWQEVVNWRGRIPVGMDISQNEYNTLGKVGGSKKINLDPSQGPLHTHVIEDEATITKSYVEGGSASYEFFVKSPGGSNRMTGQPEEGAATDINILNPYRTVLFIEYIG